MAWARLKVSEAISTTGAAFPRDAPERAVDLAPAVDLPEHGRSRRGVSTTPAARLVSY
jgi:hypothetical protein